MNLKEYTANYLRETIKIAETVSQEAICEAVTVLRSIQQEGGRLFILGVGGSAANASHAVNDFRKIAGIESYTPTDNVSELTAWTNDVGWDCVFRKWLEESKLSEKDGLLIFSVGGGSATVSNNLVHAMELARERGSKILAVVSRSGGMAKEYADVAILVPVVAEERITPHAEGWQCVIWHLLVNALAHAHERG